MYRPGFTLVEVLLTVAIAATGLGALIGLSRQSARQDATGERVAALELCVTSHLDTIAHRSWDELVRAAESPGATCPLPGPALPDSLAAWVTEERAQVILVEEGLARVEVVVRWSVPGLSRPGGSSLSAQRLVDRTDAGLGGENASIGW